MIHLFASFYSRSYQAHQSKPINLHLPLCFKKPINLIHYFQTQPFMDSVHKHIFYSIKNQQNTNYQPPLPNSENGFPILAIAVLGIMAAAFLLVSYYVFVTKCCLNWQQLDSLRRFSMSRARRHEDPLMMYSPSLMNHGLDDLLIREIPTFQYSKGEGEERSLYQCVVCLNDFQEQELLRVLPNCSHGFHLDCIDIWLQTNAKCPLCRSSISGTTRYPMGQIVAPTSSPQDPQPFISGGGGGGEDFVVIELSEDDGTVTVPCGQQRRNNHSRENLGQSRNHSPRKLEPRSGKVKPRNSIHVSMMGDECIDIRHEDDQFSIQPIRRSFSMDSASDRNVYLSVQNMIQENRRIDTVRDSEECSSRVRRSFFSFGHGRGSRSAVLPIESDL